MAVDILKLFQGFLETTVNLNPGRVDKIEDAQRILPGFIHAQKEFEDLYIEAKPQGSYRQKTIIKPVGEEGTFDVDILIRLKENPEWSPADYLSKLAQAFRDSGRYADITDTRGKTRCITIDYEGEFHVDLVPVIDRGGQQYICNKREDRFESTDGDGYAQWFEGQDATSGGYLVHAVRLLKYLRDYQGKFATKSIILTTIAGMQIYPGDSQPDLPRTFAAILNRMDEFLSLHSAPPAISNPAMPGETFERHWSDDQAGFERLKKAIAFYSRLASQALEEDDPDEAVQIWGQLFGPGFEPKKEDAIPESGVPHYSPAPSFIPSKPHANS